MAWYRSAMQAPGCLSIGLRLRRGLGRIVCGSGAAKAASAAVLRRQVSQRLNPLYMRIHANCQTYAHTNYTDTPISDATAKAAPSINSQPDVTPRCWPSLAQPVFDVIHLVLSQVYFVFLHPGDRATARQLRQSRHARQLPPPLCRRSRCVGVGLERNNGENTKYQIPNTKYQMATARADSRSAAPSAWSSTRAAASVVCWSRSGSSWHAEFASRNCSYTAGAAAREYYIVPRTGVFTTHS